MHTLSHLKCLSWIVLLVAAAALPSAAQQTQQTDEHLVFISRPFVVFQIASIKFVDGRKQ